MNILICNDDGYLAEGIAVLARAAGELANVRVVAPESDRSGVSNSLTLNRPLSLKQAGNGFYYVNGTPTDCIHIALHALPDFKPDLVLSGINHGANMGDDTLYSGTVAAATEAYLLGIPAVAFSLNDRSGRYWQTAEAVVGRMLAHLLSQPPKLPVLWSVNIPAVDNGDIQGLRTARLGRRHHIQMVAPVHNPRGEKMYWIGYAGGASDAGEGTDFDGNAGGWVTVTPLSVDLTDYPRLENLAAYWQDAGL